MKTLASIIILLAALSPTPALSLATPALSIVMPLPPQVSARRVRRVRRHCVSVRCTMLRAIRITHAPRSWLGPLLWIAWRESRDNPRAVAYEGTAGGYAEGIMQMVPSTFEEHALPKMKNIWSPLDNTVSSIRYIASRYGAPTNIPGIEMQNYGGY